MWRTLGNKPLIPLPRERSRLWVIGTHVATSLFATLIVLFIVSCLSSVILRVAPNTGDFAGLAILSVQFAVAGFAAASHSGQYLRNEAEFPQPTALVKQCTIWFAAVLLILLIAAAARQSSWLVRVVIPLTGCPCVAAFWWQTCSQFRKWELEQPPPKSYGFSVIPLNPTPPTPHPGEADAPTSHSDSSPASDPQAPASH